jgi:hypothetical protein
MISPSLVMVVVAAAVALITLRPSTLHAPLWRATVTPLASIIGSGFLVAGPILGHVAGPWAWLAMLGLCGAGYLFGSAIRHNIAVVEPLLADRPPRAVAVLERTSDFALAFAYFVSVAYYLSLFASFALRADEIIDPVLTRWFSSAMIVILGVLGATRGLHALENVEAGAVGLKLALIAGVLAALALATGRALWSHSLVLPATPHEDELDVIGTLLGLVILVQGFETSRYLGAAYDPATRIRTMRAAQLLSTAIYVSFVLLVTPYFLGRLPAEGGETWVIDMLVPLGSVVAPLLIFAALASQLSAAVADMNGAGGLLAGATHGVVSARLGYLATAAAALVVIWSGNIYEIIVYATKAFVVYYGLQCVLAALVALRGGKRRSPGKALLFAAGTALAVTIVIFGIPAEVG